jgi:putative transcriptional regulator
VENTLRVLRATKNITQEDLAKALGVTRQTIHAIETGKYNPSLDLAFKIAIHFDTKIEDVFTYKEDSSLTS